jgi:benzoate-CoA ligase family protein
MTNATIEFLDRHLALGRGGSTAIVTPAGASSYAEVLALASRAGHALRGLGVEPEQRVAMLLPDSLDFVAVFWGALRIGAVAVPLSTRLAPDDCAAILRDSRARVLVADAGLAEALGSRLLDLPRLRVVPTGGGDVTRGLDALMADASQDLAPEPLSPDDMAFWLYTSGTTGLPKAAVHLHRDLLACRPYAEDVLGLGAEDRIFATSRLFFAYALGAALITPFHAGAPVYLHPGWPDPAVVAHVMSSFRPTILFSVPTFYRRLLHAAEIGPDTFAPLRFGVSAGERLPPEIYLAYRERFGLELVDGMGATETVFMVLSNRPGQSRPGSSGTPVPGTEVRLLDTDGGDVADGKEGVLHVRTPSASPGYWKRIDASRRAFLGPWFRTGDVYTRDAEGFYHHCGREDDLFKVAGMWVVPADVEAVLQAHPDILEAGVVGAEEAAGLLKCFAFVVPRPGAERSEGLAAELAALVEQKLPPHQRPRRTLVVPELPRTATGKLQRFLLRQWVEAARVSPAGGEGG